MRKTTSYFVRKMEIMQKLTTIEWIGERLRGKRKEISNEYQRMYFRYETLGEVEEKFSQGQVLSGLTTMKNDYEYLEDHIWIVFGGKKSKLSKYCAIN